MAAFDASPWLGERTVRPTEAELQQIANRDTGLHGVGLDRFLRHLGLFVLPFSISTDPNNNTKNSLEFTAKFPFKVVGIHVGCESAAGSAATGDIQKNPTGSPDTFATMSTGAVDIKTAAGDFVDLPVLSGSEDIAYGDQLRFVVVGTGAGAVVGCRALLTCIRL